MEKETKSRRGCIKAAAGFLIAVIIFTAACAITFGVSVFMSKRSIAVSQAKGEALLPTVVIDAGHGGLDSGAVGVDGSLEKDINLSVAMKLYSLCRAAGIECALTRTEDAMLVDEDVKSHRKMHDLKNRLAVVDSFSEADGGAVLVSIHMNNFSVPKYSGLQVWYSGNNESGKQLASYVQSYARTWLAPDNNREIKRATSAIYILDRAAVPAILVECGFLSNPEECAKLGTEAYQTELALTIFAAICGWMPASTK